MSYQWSSQGPAFEYPACFRVENRFLTLRAAVLMLCALAVFWVALADPDPVAQGVQLRVKAERGNPVPHVLMAVLMLGLGLTDLLAAARQRRVLLQPGQPASLVSEVARRSTGTSSGASWLMQVLRHGQVPAGEPKGDYLGALQRVAGNLAYAPSGLLTYLRVRVAHLIAGAGLLLALALTWPAAAQPATLALASLLYAALAAALVARSAWISKDAPAPFALGVVLMLSLAIGVAIALLGGGVPQVARLKQLALPQATLLLLVCLLVIEGLGLLAGRAQLGGQPRVDLQGADADTDIDADPTALMQEIERELHRYWAEGIPNRRHAWEPLLPAGKAGAGQATAVVLEESQPLPTSEPTPLPRTWLLVLGVLGLLLTTAGAVLWVLLANAQITDPLTASWGTGPAALVLMVAGGYAVRVGHLPWSRTEVDSMLLWLTLQPGGQAGREAAVHMQARMVKARSVFHVAGEHVLGSRVLLRLAGDAASAKRLVQQVQAFAERTPPAGVPAAPAAPRPGPVPGAPGRAAAAPRQPAAPVARYCPACGTAVLQGARFCQHCGASLTA